MPENHNTEARPHRELTTQEDQGNSRPEPTADTALTPLSRDQGWYNRPHSELVTAFKGFLKERAHPSGKGYSPEEAVRLKLELESQTRPFADDRSNEKRTDFFWDLLFAWDALAYNRYSIGSREEVLAGGALQAYHREKRDPSVKLADPLQVRIIDALTEAVGIPHQKGRSAIPISENLQNYSRYQLTPEYQTAFIKNHANRDK